MGGRGQPGLWLTTLAFAIGGAGAWLLGLGYRFEQYDQLQYLLLPYRSIDPDFLPGDWFTWATDHYHVSFSWLVRGLHAAGGDAGLPAAMFALHVLVVAALSLAILTLARALSRSDGEALAAAATCVLAAAWLRAEGIAGATFGHGYPVPADLALPALLLAVAAWIGGRPRACGAALGLSGLLHANFAVLGPLVLGLAELSCVASRLRGGASPRAALRAGWSMGLWYLPLAAPSLWLIASQFATGDPHPEAVDIILRVRSPHHYALSAMSPVDGWWLAWWAALALVASAFERAHGGEADAAARERRARERRVRGSLWVVLLLGLVGSLVGSGTVVRLFCWRMSIPLCCLLMLRVGGSLWRAARTRHPATATALALGVLSAAVFVRSDLALVAGLGLPPSLFALLPILLLLAAAALTRFGTPLLLRGGLVLVLLVSLWSAHGLWQPPRHHLRSGLVRQALLRLPGDVTIDLRPAPARDRRGKLGGLHRVVRERTPKDARFLIPPHMVDFRLATRRAVFVDFKAAPMRGDQALEWKRRMLAAMGRERFETTGYVLRYAAGRAYADRPLAALAALARREGMTHLVAPTRPRQARRIGLREIVTDGERTGPFSGAPMRWTLYELPDA